MNFGGLIEMRNIGHLSRHVSPPDYGPKLNYAVWILTTLSTLFLSLRVYCKLWRNRLLWWDDYVLIMSWTCLLGAAALVSICVSYGYGKPYTDINPGDLPTVTICSLAAGFAAILTAAWSKTSFALTLLRISNGKIKIFLWFVAITVNAVLAVSASFQWIQCWPLQRLWDFRVPGTCWPKAVVYYDTAAAGYCGALDIVLAVLPWKLIWSASINRKERVGVVIAMSMGVFAGIMSFLKLLAVSSVGTDDISLTADLMIFGIAEGAVTIMAVSVPVLRTLFVDLSRKTQQPAKFITVDGGR